jgi:hypothetical protein
MHDDLVGPALVEVVDERGIERRGAGRRASRGIDSLQQTLPRASRHEGPAVDVRSRECRDEDEHSDPRQGIDGDKPREDEPDDLETFRGHLPASPDVVPVEGVPTDRAVGRYCSASLWVT